MGHITRGNYAYNKANHERGIMRKLSKILEKDINAYFIVIAIQDDLLVLRLHGLDTFLDDMIPIVIAYELLYPRLQFL